MKTIEIDGEKFHDFVSFALAIETALGESFVGHCINSVLDSFFQIPNRDVLILKWKNSDASRRKLDHTISRDEVKGAIENERDPDLRESFEFYLEMIDRGFAPTAFQSLVDAIVQAGITLHLE